MIAGQAFEGGSELIVNFRDVASLIARGRAAAGQVRSWHQQRVDEMVASAGWHVYEKDTARQLAIRSCHETGMGELEETLARLRKRVLGTLRDLRGVVTSGIVEQDPVLGLKKIAKPIGVIAAMTPATAPAAAVAQNSLLALKTRNAVIFCPNPKAKQSCSATVDRLRAALRVVDAPMDLVQCIDEPSREHAEALMSGADLILAAGGRSTVTRAYSSGTPAYGAGVGNAVVIIDETADVQDACAKVFSGKAFDNGTSCSSESSIVVAEEIWDAVITQLRLRGAHLCDTEEAQRLCSVVWPDNRNLARQIVGRNAEVIARSAGIHVAAGTRVLMVAPACPPDETPLSGEKLSPILAVWKYRTFEQAIELVCKLLDLSGRGHSVGIHTRMAHRAEQLAHTVDASRVLVNQSTGQSNSGDFTNGMPFTATLCCGSWGGSITNDNITWHHLLNHTWISEPIAARSVEPEVLFAEYWRRYGRTIRA